MTRVIAYAYACEPDKGSEPGAGWALARMVAGFTEVHVITRANNRTAIESRLSQIPENDNLHFHYVDLPERSRRWKRGQRGVRLYYLLWQRAALKVARRLHREQPFDIAWHLTLGNVWLGSNLGRLGLPFVFGPVGGGVVPPLRLIPSLGPRGIAYEATRVVLRVVNRYANTNARSAWRRASLILTQNPPTTRWFPRSAQVKCRVFQHALLESSDVPEARSGGTDGRSFVYVGRLLPWKGVALAIGSIGASRDARLTIFGDGPDRSRIEKLTRRAGVEGRVSFRGSAPRADVGKFLREEADALLFPSLHDDSPLAVAEAAAAGIPVICLDIGGTPLVAGPAAVALEPSGTSKDVVTRLARALSAPETWPRNWDRSAHVIEKRRPVLRALLEEAGVL